MWFIQENVDLFPWAPSNMGGIDTDTTCHHLAIKLGIILIVQRKRKKGEDKRTTIIEEVKKLKEAKLI